MTSKQEIKDLFIAELINTPEYTDVINIKALIKHEIETPNIQQCVKYIFSSPKSEEQLAVLNMCMMVEFGFKSESYTSKYIVIEMMHFLL
jgi:hypothetical protein